TCRLLLRPALIFLRAGHCITSNRRGGEDEERCPPIRGCRPTPTASLPSSLPRLPTRPPLAIGQLAAFATTSDKHDKHFALRPCTPRQCSACLATCTFPAGAGSSRMAIAPTRL